jgi:hypothetical protein
MLDTIKAELVRSLREEQAKLVAAGLPAHALGTVAQHVHDALEDAERAIDDAAHPH